MSAVGAETTPTRAKAAVPLICQILIQPEWMLAIVLGAGPCSVSSVRHRATVLGQPKNPENRNGEKTMFTILVACFSNTFLTCIMCLETIF